MAKTLKELELEYPGWCFEGNRVALGALIAAKQEDEARIAVMEKSHDGLMELAEQFKAMYEKYGAQLTAEQQAHAETRRQLDSMTVTMRAIVRMADVEDADLRRIIRETAQASINRPTDKAPTDDRGEGEM